MNGVERLLAEGREQGREQTLREMLSKLLTARFGALDAESTARVDRASADEMDTWALRVLTAKSLPEVFDTSPRAKR